MDANRIELGMHLTLWMEFVGTGTSSRSVSLNDWFTFTLLTYLGCLASTDCKYMLHYLLVHCNAQEDDYHISNVHIAACNSFGSHIGRCQKSQLLLNSRAETLIDFGNILEDEW